MKVRMPALRAPWVQMQGGPTQAMRGHRRGGLTQQMDPRRRKPKADKGKKQNASNPSTKGGQTGLKEYGD